jgi:diguanylate cyclase (GGDEF)-like protein
VPTADNKTDRDRLLRRFASSALTSLLFVCILWVVHRFDLLGDTQFYIACAATLACIVTFYLLIRSGWNERRKDPSLSVPMMLASISVNTYVLYSMQTAGGVFLLIYLVSMLFGVFHLATQQMLRVATVILLLYGLVIWLHWSQSPGSTDIRVELLQWAVLAFVVVWFSIMVGYIHTLMARVDQAEFDELTGAYTRRRIFAILRHEKLRADRGAGPLCVCLLDLDNLKRVNDALGHQAVDLQLKMVVLAVQRELRNIDYIGRYGGDEFLLVLTQTPVAGARECADRFRRALEALSATEIGAGLAVTISVGITEYRVRESITQTVRRADAALYRAKAGGRNRIECAPTGQLAQSAR